MSESLCINLETAIKFKQLGWNKPTVHVWFDVYNRSKWSIWFKHNFADIQEKVDKSTAYYAPTLEEIELPDYHIINKCNGKFSYSEIDSNNNIRRSIGYFKTEIEARAAFWIYLEKEKIKQTIIKKLELPEEIFLYKNGKIEIDIENYLKQINEKKEYNNNIDTNKRDKIVKILNKYNGNVGINFEIADAIVKI